MKHKQSLLEIANLHIPFPLAAEWAGIAVYGSSERGVKVYCPFPQEHLDGGREKALRVYSDHGWCFAEQKYFTPVSLLAAAWEVSPEDAAKKALDKTGYVPVTYAHLWEDVQRDPEPDWEALAMALREYCRSICPDWAVVQYNDEIAHTLARCLGLLPLAHTEEDCRTWLEACQKIMKVSLT